MFGEDHYEQGDEAFFMKLMPRLRKMGYRTLAIEMGTGQQELIDKYLKGKISERELAERFRRDFGMLSEQHTDVLHEAKKLGMRAVAYHRSEGASESEIGKVQFGAIKENILDKRRGEKFLVFCGSTHMNRSQEKKDLGYYLDRNVKGNFTILQNFGQAEFAEVHAGYDVDLLINWAQMKQESA